MRRSIFGYGAVGFCTARPAALHQSLCQLTLTPPFTQGRLWFPATPLVQLKTEPAVQRGADCHTSDIGHWFAMTRWRTATALHRAMDHRPYHTPPVLRTSPRRRKVRELRFRLWGEKLRSLPFARRKSPWGTPPFPTEPHSAAVSSFAALRMRHTPCGYFVGLRRGPHCGDFDAHPPVPPL